VAQTWLTAIGRDRPGIVAGIARVLADHAMNIEDSQMRILGGHFAMMLLVEGGADEKGLADDLRAASEELGLDYLYVHPVPASDAQAAAPTHVLTVYGRDHPGIVAAVTAVLAEHSVNVTDLQTRLAGDVYALFLELELPPGADIAEAVAAVGREQGVDVSLRELERDSL
jgi:glycine cleavage system transcriptional repressor